MDKSVLHPRWYRILLSLDQLLNVLVFDGSEDETISASMWRTNRRGWVGFIDWLFSSYEKDHCKSSFDAELERAQAYTK